MSEEKTTCKAINNNKKQCSFNCVEGSEYCSRHVAKLNKPKKEVKICEAKNQKKEQCPWKAIDGEIYCKRHLSILGNNKEEENKFCSGCKNYLPPSKWKNNDAKTCIKCSARCKENRQKSKNKRDEIDNKCIGHSQITNKKCNNYANKKLEFSDYCGEHQTLAKKISLEINELKVCSNWIRNCFNTFETEFIKGKEIINCIECRKKTRKIDNDKYSENKKNAIEFNKKSDKDILMCYVCNCECNKNDVNNNKCKKCDHKQKSSEQSRKNTNPLQDKLESIKKGSKDRNIEFNITDEFAKELIINKCSYCNEFNKLSGIDRINSSLPYELNNCVACCKHCNIMKGEQTVKNFKRIIEYLVYINGFLNKTNENNSKINKYKNLFENAKNPKFNKFMTDATLRKITVSISKEQWKTIIKKPCQYCKNNFDDAGSNGIDRVDSSFGYSDDNIVPCCKTCNLMKNVLSVDEFYSRIKKIYNKYNSIIDTEPTIREKIINLLESNDKKKHEKYILKDDNEYKKLIFNPKSIDDVKNVKISFEFCENKNETDKGIKLKDIWNYFRKKVSSLITNENARSIGRQIYILIKDKTTKKYLGIMSITSDNYNMAARDDYIGWNQTVKIDKLQYIVNISTCVPLYPFGFNFNGGKLIASLAFSKEIMNYYENKYEEYNKILGITTTSLYGKSIMYDRLSCLKYLDLTKGNSTYEINDAVCSLCKQFLSDKHGKKVDSKKKLNYLTTTFKYLGISPTYLQSNGKGIYFGFTCKDSKDFLNGTSNKCPDLNKKKYNIKTAQEIYDEWVDRWANNRFNHLKKTNRFINDDDNITQKIKKNIDKCENNSNNSTDNDLVDFIDEMNTIENISYVHK